jgi:surface protein
MQSMFAAATIFNQNISGWNVSGVTNMSFMFVGDSSFNQPIGSWNVSNVTTMNSMFGSGAFNQDIGSWDVSNVTNFSQFMYGKSFTDFSTTNLDSIYNGWSSLPSLNSGLNINFGTIKYTAGGSAGKSILSGTYGWTITDGGI